MQEIRFYSDGEWVAIQKKMQTLSYVNDDPIEIERVNQERIAKKRKWMVEYGATLIEKYIGLAPEEVAFNIIYFDHMQLDPNDIVMERVSPTKIRIESHNFCPYLESCNIMGLDTRVVCKDTGEPSFQAMAEMIHPNLRFFRNYDHLRPHADYCEEFIELVNPITEE